MFRIFFFPSNINKRAWTKSFDYMLCLSNTIHAVSLLDPGPCPATVDSELSQSWCSREDKGRGGLYSQKGSTGLTADPVLLAQPRGRRATGCIPRSQAASFPPPRRPRALQEGGGDVDRRKQPKAAAESGQGRERRTAAALLNRPAGARSPRGKAPSVARISHGETGGI